MTSFSVVFEYGVFCISTSRFDYRDELGLPTVVMLADGMR